MNKITIFKAVVLTTFLFIGIALVQTTPAFAQATCAACGDTTGGTPTGGTPTNGGGDSTPAPVCNITASATSVDANGQYTVAWDGTPSNATFKMNGDVVNAKDSITVNFDGNYDYFRYVLYGVNAGGECSREVVIYKNVTAPVCDISLDITSADIGDAYTVTWGGSPVEGVFKINGSSVPDSGNAPFHFVGPNTDSYTMTGVNGSKTCTKTVTVSKKVPNAPACVLNSDKDSVTAGGAVRLTWTSTNAASGSIDQTVGVIDPNNTAGYRTPTVNATTTYTMTVVNSVGAIATCQKTVNVTPVTTVPAPACVLNANNSSIVQGGAVRLTWTSTNAVSGSIDQTVGVIDPNNTTDYRNHSPLSTIVYKMTVRNSAGAIATCERPVTVTNPTAPLSCANNVNLSVSPSTIDRGGNSTITWTTSGLTSLSFNNGVTSTNLNDSFTVSPLTTTTYTMTAIKGSESVTCPVTVNVDQPSSGGGGGSSSPSCRVTVSASKINLGDRVTIKWDTSRATDILLKDSHGKTLIDTDDMSTSEKKDLYDGEITIRPDSDTTYTLTAARGSRDRDCKVSVDVEDSIVVTQVRDQKPLVTGIALTQVPYTGFEAGPFLTSVFYTLLAAWALYMAYVLAGRRNGKVTGQFTPATVLADTVARDSMFPEAVTMAPVFYQAATATPAATTATVGYAAHVDAASAIEAQAHAAKVLLSSDAIAYFIAATAGEDRESILSGVLSAAKAAYPSEDGWVVVSVERMMELAAKY